MYKLWRKISPCILLFLLLYGIIAKSNDVTLTVIALSTIDILKLLSDKE